MKKSICLLVIAILLVSLSMNVLAVQDITIKVDGKTVSFSNAKPCFDDSGSRVLVPAKFAADYLGAEVLWNNDTQTTTVKKGSSFINLKVGEKTFTANSLGIRKLESANIFKDGTAYIPLRFISEALGAEVAWNGDEQTVEIKRSAAVLADDAKGLLKGISVYDQSTVRLQGDKIIYIDPISISGEPHDADIIMVTHTHRDHFSIDDIKKLAKATTTLLIPADGVEKARDTGISNIIEVAPLKDYEVQGVKVKAVNAYNTVKQNHKKENNWVGYIVYINNISYYVAGDTDFIPEMKDIKADVIFLPIDGKYNMPEDEAASAANAIVPKLAIPYHFNNFSTEESARKFISLLDKKIKGAILTFKICN